MFWLRELMVMLPLVLVPVGVLGFSQHEWLWGLCIGLGAALLRQLRQLWQVYRWFRTPEQPVPWANGGWGAMLSRLHRYRQAQHRRQKRLNDAVLRMGQTAEAMTDAIVAIDSHGQLDSWNHAAQRILGLNTQEHRGQVITDVLKDEQFVRYYEDQHYDEPLVRPSPIDASYMLQYRITPFGNDERLLIVSDVTRLHRLEQMRRDFVANVSHELRTPLTVLRGYLETFEQAANDILPPRLARGIGQMQQQAERMQHLTDDLLMLSRLENDTRTTPHAIMDIAALIDNVRRDGIALSESYEHTLTMKVEPGYSLYGDPLEIRSAITNLVSNAVRYSGQQRTIQLNWTLVRNAQGKVQEGILEVADNGDGIDQRHLPRLTERFYRVDKGRSSATGGTGLGLAIVKHVMLRHKGYLTIKSAPGEGASFSLHFSEDRLIPNGL